VRVENFQISFDLFSSLTTYAINNESMNEMIEMNISVEVTSCWGDIIEMTSPGSLILQPYSTVYSLPPSRNHQSREVAATIPTISIINYARHETKIHIQ
jgi:hypothetical protein